MTNQPSPAPCLRTKRHHRTGRAMAMIVGTNARNRPDSFAIALARRAATLDSELPTVAICRNRYGKAHQSAQRSCLSVFGRVLFVGPPKISFWKNARTAIVAGGQTYRPTSNQGTGAP